MSATPDAFGGHNLAFVEGLYAEFLRDPAAVDPAWRALFEPLETERPAGLTQVGPTVAPRSIFDPAQAAGEGPAPAALAPAAGALSGAPPAATLAAVGDLQLQDRLDQLVAAFRARGHLAAALDPLDRAREPCPELEPAHYGITQVDFPRSCSSSAAGGRTVGQVIEHLRNTYCRSIGVQFSHVENAEAKEWLQAQMEATENRCPLGHDEQVKLLSKLIDAEVFEQFIRRKFLGAKSFSLEGGESLIPLLDLAIEHAAEDGAEEVIFGMAHRGRLSVLTNIMGKHPREIFREFADSDNEKYWGSGDVKYHMGFRSTHTTAGGKEVRLRLAFNPSHLEFVGAVVLGRTRARQDRMGDGERRKVVPIILHGDSAFAGQGIVQETLNMSKLAGYATGGTLHVIVNNQIGFTTPPGSSRSTGYATDVALMLRVPIFHVNGEHPESVAQVVRLAMEFRARFRSDVFIDMYCYRRHGHNEGDEPSFTQPLMYEAIRKRPTVREAYLEKLIGPGGLAREEAERIVSERTRFLEEELSRAQDRDYEPPVAAPASFPWNRFVGGKEADAPTVDTGHPRAELVDLLRRLAVVPDDLRVLGKLRRVLDQRIEMAEGKRRLDWAAGEALAFATLLGAGHAVRLSGQDAGRGTFSHRHAVLRDMGDERTHVPLQHLSPDQARFEVYDSPLSEAGVLGFDYGYSLDRPSSLVIWEAQFGDFCNGAQVIIDQFISSAEDKWDLLSGLTMLLPHGFEGQGPEHSSARVERFLQLCAEDNMQVVNPTTPAQIFHLLRRQTLRPWRKPLVVFTPKSLLRHPEATSSLDELAAGGFQPVIPDPDPPETARRILLCSGRVYYDLVAYRRQRTTKDVLLVRVEQLYPFPHAALQEALAPFVGPERPEDLELVWVQEEPLNMGAWYYLRALFGETLGGLPLRCNARDESASPATGSPTSHKREQEFLITRAFWSR